MRGPGLSAGRRHCVAGPRYARRGTLPLQRTEASGNTRSDPVLVIARVAEEPDPSGVVPGENRSRLGLENTNYVDAFDEFFVFVAFFFGKFTFIGLSSKFIQAGLSLRIETQLQNPRRRFLGKAVRERVEESIQHVRRCHIGHVSSIPWFNVAMKLLSSRNIRFFLRVVLARVTTTSRRTPYWMVVWRRRYNFHAARGRYRITAGVTMTKTMSIRMDDEN